MRISDWSSDVCSSDLALGPVMETFFGINGIFQTPPSGLDPNKNQGRGFQRSLARSGAPGRFRTSHPPNRNAGQCCRPLVSRPFAELGRAHVCTPVTNAHLVCRLLLAI